MSNANDGDGVNDEGSDISRLRRELGLKRQREEMKIWRRYGLRGEEKADLRSWG